MSKLQGYDIWAGVQGIEYVTYESGEWVKYEDVKELEEEVARLCEENKRLEEEAKEWFMQRR